MHIQHRVCFVLSLFSITCMGFRHRLWFPQTAKDMQIVSAGYSKPSRSKAVNVSVNDGSSLL